MELSDAEKEVLLRGGFSLVEVAKQAEKEAKEKLFAFIKEMLR